MVQENKMNTLIKAVGVEAAPYCQSMFAENVNLSSKIEAAPSASSGAAAAASCDATVDESKKEVKEESEEEEEEEE